MLKYTYLCKSKTEGFGKLKRYWMFLLFGVQIIFLLPVNSTAADSNVSFEIDLITGFSKNNLSWSIAGVGNDPNILSELKYNDLQIYHYGISATLSVYDFFIKPEIIKGHIYEGWATDADYSKDNRKSLTFKSEKDVKDNDTSYISILFGYDFKFMEKFSLSPIIGYSRKKQEIIMTNGSVLYPEIRKIIGLYSTYAINWQGLLVGIQSTYPFQAGISFNAFFHFHYLEYLAVANWNLRTDLSHPVSFRHTGYGQGLEYGGGVSYSTMNWKFDFSYMQRLFNIEDGRDELFFSTGGSIRSKLNKVEWRSNTLTFAISYAFK